VRGDIYAVGLLRDIKQKRARVGLAHYVWPQLKRRNWRAVRNYFRNGYLTEHPLPCHHNAGWGWSKRASIRRAEKQCRKAYFLRRSEGVESTKDSG
jgi:hypothetical protein